MKNKIARFGFFNLDGYEDGQILESDHQGRNQEFLYFNDGKLIQKSRPKAKQLQNMDADFAAQEQKDQMEEALKNKVIDYGEFWSDINRVPRTAKEDTKDRLS